MLAGGPGCSPGAGLGPVGSGPRRHHAHPLRGHGRGRLPLARLGARLGAPEAPRAAGRAAGRRLRPVGLPLGPARLRGRRRRPVRLRRLRRDLDARGLGTTALSVLPSRYPQADPTIFAGTAGGLLRSPDAGAPSAPRRLSGTAVQRLEWPGPALVHGDLAGRAGLEGRCAHLRRGRARAARGRRAGRWRCRRSSRSTPCSSRPSRDGVSTARRTAARTWQSPAWRARPSPTSSGWARSSTRPATGACSAARTWARPGRPSTRG